MSEERFMCNGKLRTIEEILDIVMESELVNKYSRGVRLSVHEHWFFKEGEGCVVKSKHHGWIWVSEEAAKGWRTYNDRIRARRKD